MPRGKNYTNEDVANAVSTSVSIRQVLSKLGLVAAGGNYASIHRLIQELELDTSHFTGMLWSKGKILGKKFPLEDYLSNRRTIQSHKLKLRLFSEGFKLKICEGCTLTTWKGLPISLELDHVDGDHDNNELSNLRVLCPNCHSQTPTYRGKNKKAKT